MVEKELAELDKSDTEKRRENKTNYRRLLQIDQIISSGRFPSTAALAEKLEASTTTVKRDIEMLRDELNAPVEYCKKNEGWYYTETAFRLPALFTSEGELFAAELTKNMVQALHDTSVYENAKTVLDAVSNPVSNPLREPDKPDFGWADDRILFLENTKLTIEKGLWDTIACAMKTNCEITFDYKKPEDAVYHMRRVRPFQLLFSLQEWSLWCWDCDRREKRIFLLTRMKNAEMTGSHFALPEDWDYRKISNGFFGAYAEEDQYAFRIRCIGGTAQFVRERTLGKNQKVEEQEDGGVILSFTGCQFYPVLRFVLSHGAEATPLAPQDLVDEWEENVNEMATAAENMRNKTACQKE
ncbi:MAG: transcriptional regulator [Treponema sp.]|nr:transcriptional regulator [Treponema sp.]